MAKVVSENYKGDPNTVLVELDDAKKTKVKRPKDNPFNEDRSNNDGGGDNNESVQDYIRNAYSGGESGEAAARRLEDERQQRLQSSVDPVLKEQQNLLTALMGRSNIEDMFNSLRQERGVADKETRISDLGKQSGSVLETLRKLPGDVTGRVAGTQTTEGQRRAIIAQEQAPLADQLGSLSNLLEGERAGLAEALQSIQQSLTLRQLQESRELEPVKAKLEFAGMNLDRAREDEANRLRNLMAGFTADQTKALSQITSMIGAKMQDEQNKQQTLMQELAQTFTSGENEKTRTFESGQAADERTFKTGEGDKAFEREQALTRLSASLRGGGGDSSGTEFERLLGMVSPDQQMKAILAKLGIQGTGTSGIPGLEFLTNTGGVSPFSAQSQSAYRRETYPKETNSSYLDIPAGLLP